MLKGFSERPLWELQISITKYLMLQKGGSNLQKSQLSGGRHINYPFEIHNYTQRACAFIVQIPGRARA